MQVIKGLYNEAIVFTDFIDEVTYDQVLNLLNQEFVSGSKIRIMPDCHAGVGCVIGTTMTIHDKVVPNLVGVDIGCGMLTINLGQININLSELDKFIRHNIPSGNKVYKTKQDFDVDITQLKCFDELDNHKYYYQSVGTLGGGNHFIEIGTDSKGNKYLIIHSGSRNLGHRVATFYQKKAIEYKQKKNLTIPNELAYLEGQDYKDYLFDMDLCVQYASVNRKKIASKILKHLNHIKIKEEFETIHNYINLDDVILRKGAISARENEKVLIPFNMRDGSIIGLGKGNPNWNYSAPHGAGRVLSRQQSKKLLSMDRYKSQMEGIYTTSVNKSTLDEAPDAYKATADIIDNIKDTIIILERIKPIYNFKAN